MATVESSGLIWAIDNGAFSGFDPVAFRRLVRRARGRRGLKWVACPDEVGDARRTGELFNEWCEELRGIVPVAFVGQDGQEDLEVQWSRFDCLFIGGTTKWKLSQAAGSLMAEAKRRGKWLHMGRVNSRKRLLTAFDSGCDSVDGSSLSMFGDTYIEKFCNWCVEFQSQRTLWERMDIMNVEHTTMLHARCPLNGSWDYYELRVELDGFLAVEDIESAANEVRGSTKTQEEIAEQLKDALPTCKLTVSGQHGQNCKTVVVV